MRIGRTLALGASLLVLVGACATGGGSTSAPTAAGSSPGGASAGDPTIKIGSDGFYEAKLMAEIYAQALEAHGYVVERKAGIGNRLLTEPALESGAINMIPEYIGSYVRFLKGTATGDTAGTMTNLQAILDGKGLKALDPTPAQDGDGFVVRQDTATQYGLVTMTDLAAVASQLKWGLPLECSTNASCGPGLKSTYGIDIATLNVENLDACSGEMATALNGKGIDVAEVCTTQADIGSYGFVLLQDDLKLIPAQNIAPVVRSDLLSAAPADFATILNAVSAKMTTEGLTTLNVDLSVNHIAIAEAAHKWLSDNGLI